MDKKNTLKSRALVLGGGGAAGNAWLIGIIAGLMEEGVDVTGADLIVGTSAGSTAAAQLTGQSPVHLYSRVVSTTMHQVRDDVKSSTQISSKERAQSHLEKMTGVIAAAANPLEMRLKMGAVALQMEGSFSESIQAQWRSTVGARLPSSSWPELNMLVPAVNARTGEPVIFDRNSGIELVDAIAASCAGGFAYRIGEEHYIDGGYRADVNVDLATGYDRVLVVPPLGYRTRKPTAWGLHVTAQVDQLREGGSNVELLVPDADSEKAMGVGMNIMDLSTRQPSARAGYHQGKKAAPKLAEFWT